MTDKKSQIAVIGGGPAGVEAASVLAAHGCNVLLFEAQSDLGHNIANKFKLFPDFSNATDLIAQLNAKASEQGISLFKSTEIINIEQQQNRWKLTDNADHGYEADAVLLTTGYEVFDARRKEELGYGIYPGVVTSIDLEHMLKNQKILNIIGDPASRVTFLQCVGSRDEKVGNNYCSKVCCVTAVKQAIETRKVLPDAEIFLFYMDLRMWGQGFEELYLKAQEEYNVRFVRGRISEAAATFDGRIQIKAEDTLVGQQVRFSTDLLVLMVGMEASCGTQKLSKIFGISNEYGFAQSINQHLGDNRTTHEGLFLAGACKRPLCITDSIADARSAAMEILRYLNKQ